MRANVASADATGVPDLMLDEHAETTAIVERANAEMVEQMAATSRTIDLMEALKASLAARCPTCNGYGTVDDPRCHDHPPMDPPCCLPCPTCAT